MFRPRVIPCLLLKDKGLVKTINFQNPNYIGDPINAVRLFNDFEADELVFLDIEASKTGKTIDLNFVKKIGEEAFMPFAVGGGISSIEQIKEILNNGAEKVVINSHGIKNPDFIKKAAEMFGSQSIIVSIDVKKESGKYKAYTKSGTKESGFDAVELAKKMDKLGAGEIIINSIDKDGTMSGFDLEIIKKVSDSVNIPVIALGGAGEISDFKKAVESGAAAVGAGSLFVYSSKNKGILINYPDKKELREIFSSS